MIKLVDIKKKYKVKENYKIALRNICVHIKKEDAVCIIGKSGAGKTILLDIIGTLQKPDSGEYYYKGNLISQYAVSELAKFRNQNIGFIFQSFNLIRNMNVLENVMLPLQYSKKNEENPKDKAMEILDKVGIADYFDRKESELSGGEQQRVAIARALITDPEIILADEPTGNLDPYNSSIVQEMLLSLNHQGKTLIQVTHDMTVAKQFKKIIHLEKGEVL
jgi:putative ABC transport system ATP-binding protein